MAIPAGTKFHGVAPEVETENRGSNLSNSQRDTYTIEEIQAGGGVGTLSSVLNNGNETGGKDVEFTSGDSIIADGDLAIKSKTTGEVIAIFRPDNGVLFYYNNDKKCETTSYGFRVGGDLRVTGLLDLFQQNDNTFAGTNAGNLDNTTGNSNAGFGENVMSAITTASQNTGVGLNSLKDNTSGNSNTAIGAEALNLNIGGSNNTAVGRDSISSASAGAGNTAIGSESLKSKTTSNFNTAVGFQSLNNLTNGFRNTAIGNSAGSTLTTGDKNIIIGDEAQPSSPSVTTELTIGSVDINKFRIPGIQQGKPDGCQLQYDATFDQLFLAETITIIPEFITATAGGSSSIGTTKNIIDITWSGGPGTFTLFLPSATAIPYRFLRIVNDSTVTANDKVDIAALPGETIDGAATYEINKPYNGVAIWSDGSNWIVIQAKST
jgi:hypothetical protein